MEPGTTQINLLKYRLARFCDRQTDVGDKNNMSPRPEVEKYNQYAQMQGLICIFVFHMCVYKFFHISELLWTKDILSLIFNSKIYIDMPLKF